MKRNYIKRFLNYLVFTIIVTVFSAANSFSAIEILSDDELSGVDGQFSEIKILNHEVANDTVRIFLDIHQEIYGTIDSVKVGYYYKDSSELAITPIQVGLSGFEGYYHGADNAHNGANFNFMKITSDFNTMGPANGATLEPWGNGGLDSTNDESIERTTTPNCNNFDWDLWLDNMQIGESPDKPQYMNGLIVRLEFDKSIYATDPHLKRIIAGSNDVQGNMYFNAQRLTGALNGLLITNSTNRSAGPKDPYKYTGAAMLVQRDPLVQSFGVTITDVEDRDTGNFLIIDLEGDHLGFHFLAGFPENGIDFNYTETNGYTGMGGIELWDASWAPLGGSGSSGMSATDPYNTIRQEEYSSE